MTDREKERVAREKLRGVVREAWVGSGATTPFEKRIDDVVDAVLEALRSGGEEPEVYNVRDFGAKEVIGPYWDPDRHAFILEPGVWEIVEWNEQIVHLRSTGGSIRWTRPRTGLSARWFVGSSRMRGGS